ncbi:MoxR family ATPase [Lentzea sp. NPDC051838]|uniref:AAA family ATPase n=1 Tax=Lentzea sp. NPDC051838 TaxID=3154849 RepID=UPI003419A1B1
MAWSQLYRGDGAVREVVLPDPPPWRTFPRPSLGKIFQPPEGLSDAVNAALCLRRPMLITGPAGSGKSTVIESVADELMLGPVLRWHVTSRSTLTDALYRYDVLGRIHAQQLQQSVDDIAPFLQLGPLGTALMPAKRPRALLIDEIDKSDLDLPSDLLEVLERGEFEIPELARYEKETVSIREWESGQQQPVARGRIRCAEFPFIVMTSNGERDFPAPFLRRCVRFTMPPPNSLVISQVVQAHLGKHPDSDAQLNELVQHFLERAERGEHLAIDQLLNAAYLLTGQAAPTGEQHARLTEQLLRELTRA